MEVFDISVGLSEDTVVYPGDPAVRFRKLKNLKEDGVELSEMTLCLHAGTHIDAPAHYLPKGKSVDELPPIIGPANVFDMSAVKETITAGDLSACSLLAGDIVLFKTQNSQLWTKKKFSKKFVSLSVDAAEHLVRKKAAAVGIDYLSIEAADSAESPVHKILMSHKIPIIEGLDLGEIEPGEYTLICLPLKVAGVEAAPARCILVR